MSTDNDLTIAYMSGLHEGRKQEQYRILRIVYEQSTAYGKTGECMWIGVKSKVRSQMSVKEACESQGVALRSEFEQKPDSRPQNCGTGHCSCIECPYPKQDWSAA